MANATRETQGAGRFLDPKVLARIRGLELRARLAVEGFFVGMHHSPHHGLSAEFADHRAYAQGDDLRHIDWKVFGRTDKYYIKEYEQETNLSVMLVVDCSESMTFQSPGAPMSKHEYATTAAAAIAYLALKQQDSVGLALFDEQLLPVVRSSNHAQHWRTLVNELADRAGPAKTSMGNVLAALAERLTHRTLLILISDLFDDVEDILLGLRQLRYHHHDVVVWNTWDPAELTFPYRGPTLFEGLESSGRVLTDPGSLRDRYLEEVERFQSRLRSGCGRIQVDYVVFNTAGALDAILNEYLGARNARLRRRSSRVLGAG